MKSTVFLLFISLSCLSFAQETGEILLVSEFSTDVLIDAKAEYSIEGSVPLPLELSPGTHVLQNMGAKNAAGNPTMKVIQVKANEQIVVSLDSKPTPESKTAENSRLRLIETELVLTGGLTLALQGDHADYYSNGAPVFHYYLQAGDRI